MLDSFISKNLLDSSFKCVAKNSYIPLAEKIVSQAKSGSLPYFVGLNGCQGSGKSTLCDFLAQYMSAQYQLNVVVLSLDDFYLSQDKRTELSLNIHPLLSTRGVPGTHDTEHIAKIFRQLTQGQVDIALPRFSKADDNPFPQSQWPIVENKVDIVLFEGWCWGVKPQAPIELINPVNQLEQTEDPDGSWRNYVNQQLTDHYLPLYNTMDFWILLKAPSFSTVFNWRLEQENKLRLNTLAGDRTYIMSAKEISEFIKYFQRLTQHAFNTMPQDADIVFELDNNRKITSKLML